MVDKQKTRVAFIHPDLGIGGAERLVVDVAVALKNCDKDVMFITNHFDKTHAFEELKNDEIPVCVIGDWIPRNVLGLFNALCAYIRMFYLSLVFVLFYRQKHQPDVYFVDQIPMAIPVLKLFGCHVIYYCHHPDLLASPSGGRLKQLYRIPINWLELQGTAMADVLLVNSEYTASVFRTTFPQIKKTIEVVYPTIAQSYQEAVTNRIARPIDDLVPEVKPSKDNVVFLSVNRFHPFKQLELAVNAFELLKSKLTADEWSNVYLVLAGGYDPQSYINAQYFTHLVNLVQSKELATKVIFFKSPNDELKADLLLSCDCLLYTPVKEHFGIVPLEAMLAGKPVIACNSGGPRETIEDNISGFLCENSAENFAEAMKKMLDKPQARRMGLRGREKMEREFSHKVFVEQINTIVDVFCRDPTQLEKIGRKRPNPVIIIEGNEERIQQIPEEKEEETENLVTSDENETNAVEEKMEETERDELTESTEEPKTESENLIESERNF